MIKRLRASGLRAALFKSASLTLHQPRCYARLDISMSHAALGHFVWVAYGPDGLAMREIVARCLLLKHLFRRVRRGDL